MNGRWTAPLAPEGVHIALGSEEFASTSALERRLAEIDLPFLLCAAPVPKEFATGAMVLIVWKRAGIDGTDGSIAYLEPAKFLEAVKSKKRRKKKP
jgi:hypothetical protein